MKAGFILIGGTGGDAVEALLSRPCERHGIEFSRFPQHTRIDDVLKADPDIRLCFGVSDPLERFVSVFWSRLRRGGPHTNTTWSADEMAVFQWFKSPTHLAEALSSEDERQVSAALFAFDALGDLKHNYEFHMESVDKLKSIESRIFMAWDMAEFGERDRELWHSVGLPADQFRTPAKPLGERARPRPHEEELSALAKRNLQTFWRKDFALYNYVLTRFAKGDLRARAVAREKALRQVAQERFVSPQHRREAIEPLLDLMALEPSNLNHIVKVAGLYAEAEDADAERGVWTEALKHRPNCVRCLKALAGLHLTSHNLEEAVDLLSAALREDPKDVSTLNGLVRTLEQLSQPHSAAELIEEFFPDLSSAAKERGATMYARVFDKANKVEAGIKLLEMRIECDPGDDNARLLLSHMYMFVAKYSKVSEVISYEQAAGNVGLMYRLAKSALSKEDIGTAQEIVGEMKRSWPDADVTRTVVPLLENMQSELDRKSEGVTDPASIVAIVGISFCGSTFLSSLLGSLEDCFSVGESHRLTKYGETDGSESRQDFDFENGDLKLLQPCDHCGTECSVFSFAFRRELFADPTNRYSKLLGKSGCRTLITSDKYNVNTIDPLQRFNSITLFKKPENAFESFYKRGLMLPMRSLEEDILAFIKIYKREYYRFLNEFRPKGQKIFLNWEVFSNRPGECLEIICGHFGLKYDPNVLSVRRADQHTFGGNKGVTKARKDSNSRTKVSFGPASGTLIEAFNRFAEQDDDLMLLTSELFHLHEEVFGSETGR